MEGVVGSLGGKRCARHVDALDVRVTGVRRGGKRLKKTAPSLAGLRLGASGLAARPGNGRRVRLGW